MKYIARHIVFGLIVYLVFASSMFAQVQVKKNINYICLSGKSFVYWGEGETQTIDYVAFEHSDFAQKILGLGLPVRNEISNDSLWNFVVGELKSNSAFTKQKPDFIWESVYYADTLVNKSKNFSWLMHEMKGDEVVGFKQFSSEYRSKESNFFVLDPIVAFLYGETIDSEDENYLNIINQIAVDQFSRLDEWTLIRKGVRSFVNERRNSYDVINYINNTGIEQLVLICRNWRNLFIPIDNNHSIKLTPIKIMSSEKNEEGKDEVLVGLIYDLLLIFITVLICGTIGLCFFFIRKRRLITTLKEARKILGALKGKDVDICIKKYKIGGTDAEKIQGLVELILVKESQCTDDIKRIEKLQSENDELRKKVDVELGKNKELAEEKKSLEERYKKQSAHAEVLRNKYQDKIQEVEIKSKKELEKYHDNYKQLIQYIEESMLIIREVDYILCKEALGYLQWDDEKSYNYLITYLLGLRTELNIIYCLFSDNKLENQLSNLQSLLIDKDKQIAAFDTLKKQPLNINFKGDIQLSEKSLMKQIYTSFNKRISPFPVKFYYGINEEDTIN
jgi:hypothetical protein